MVTPIFSETLEGLQHFTWYIPESQRHTLNFKLPTVEGPKNAELNKHELYGSKEGGEVLDWLSDCPLPRTSSACS
jgi:hypothetical protein